jgi:hypothetical protein
MKIMKALNLFGITVIAAGAIALAPNHASAAVYADPADTDSGVTLFTYINPTGGPSTPLVYSGAGSSASYVADSSGNLFLFTADADGSGSWEEKTTGGTDLLSGIFTGLFNPVGVATSTAFLSFDVTYQAGADLSNLNNGVPGDTGTLTLELSNPTVESGSVANSYAYDSYGTTYALTPGTSTGGLTPEPSPAIAIGIASVGLLGLLMFNKKRSSGLV